jgi:hypothetical protein
LVFAKKTLRPVFFFFPKFVRIQMIFQDGILCLSPSSSITKASFKFWLETELNTFHACNRSERFVMVFVFVSEAFAKQFQPERLDMLLKQIRSKAKKWMSEIEVIAGQHYTSEESIYLFIDELNKVADELALNKSELFMGYADELEDHGSTFDEEHDPVCVISKITKDMIAHMSQDEIDLGYQEGDWSVSGGTHEDKVISKPFKSLNEAMDAAKERFGTVRFDAAPEIMIGN